MTFQQEILLKESHEGFIQNISEEIGYKINSTLMIHQHIGHYLSSHLNYFHKVLGKFSWENGKKLHHSAGPCHPNFCTAVEGLCTSRFREAAVSADTNLWYGFFLADVWFVRARLIGPFLFEKTLASKDSSSIFV